MKPDDILDYLEQKAKQLPALPHDGTPANQGFAVVEDSYDLDEFNRLITTSRSLPIMLVEEETGNLYDNNNANYRHTIRVNFMIVDKLSSGASLRALRAGCYDIGVGIIALINKDKPLGILPGKRVDYNVNSNYTKLGPIDGDYYGYLFELEFSAPIRIGSCQ